MRERIKQIIEREHMGQSQFADFIGVNRPTLSHILAGRNNPSLEVVMRIRQKFPKINTQWLLDGTGPYEGDAESNYATQPATDIDADGSDATLQIAHTAGDAQGTAEETAGQATSRFFQGDLFAENAVFVAESAGAPKNRKEMPLQTPQKAPYLSESQIEYARKSLQRKIVEIKIFFDDGTYETFKP